MTPTYNSVFLTILCYSCAETIGYLEVADGDDVRDVPIQLQELRCQKCKDERVKEKEELR